MGMFSFTLLWFTPLVVIAFLVGVCIGKKGCPGKNDEKKYVKGAGCQAEGFKAVTDGAFCDGDEQCELCNCRECQTCCYCDSEDSVWSAYVGIANKDGYQEYRDDLREDGG